MGTHQIYRGDPTQKQYYVTSNFNGGINTLDVDENMRDNEFRDLVNVDIATQGIIQSRRGFESIDLLNKTLDYYNITLPTENISYIEILKNENNVLDNFKDKINYNISFSLKSLTKEEFYGLTDVETLYDLSIEEQPTILQELALVRDVSFTDILDWDGDTYSKGQIVFYLPDSRYYISTIADNTETPGISSYWVILEGYLSQILNSKYTNYSEFISGYAYAVGDTRINTSDGNIYVCSEAGTYNTINSNWTLYIETNYYLNDERVEIDGSFKILIINENHISLLEYKDYVLSYTNLLNNEKELPVASTYKNNLLMKEPVHHINNIYISLNDISEEYKGILVYNRDTDTWTTWRGQQKIDNEWVNFDTDLLTDVYMPKPYDISSSSVGLVQGFNVLAESPLLYIDSQGTNLFELRNLIISSNISFLGETFFLDGNHIDKIPTTGNFFITVVKTGNQSIAPESLVFIFKDEAGNILDFKIGNNAIGEYGVKYGGIFNYYISNLNLTGVSYVLLDVIYQNKVITKLNTMPEYLESGDFNTLNNYYSVKDESYVYKMIKDYTTGRGGRLLSDYSKHKVIASTEVDDLSSVDVNSIFAAYKTANCDGGYFQLKQGDLCEVYIYGHSTLTFTKQTNTDGVLYDNFYDFIPMNGTLIDVGDSSYYLYNNIANNSMTINVNKTYIDLDLDVLPIEGQYYDIGNEEPEDKIDGFDLEDVKLITIDNKLVYYKGNSIYFSNIYQFDYVPNFAFVILPLLSTDEIVNIKYFKGSWIIFTKYTIWKMKGTYGDADWSITLLNNSIGCVAPKTIVSIENSLYFLSQNGLYRLTQNYYQDGLENVAKADKLIPDLIPIDAAAQGLLYRDQYIIYLPDEYDFDTVRMYYNIDLPDKQKPFVKDLFKVRPNNLFIYSGNLLSIKNGKIYIYDEGYTDFMPSDAISDTDYVYNVIIESSALNFGYPTHDKKIKSIYVKTKTTSPTYLYFTIWLDGYLRAEPTSFRAVLDDDEQIVYEEYIDYTKDSNIKLNLDELGELELGNGVLGDNENSTHKITLGYKGKTIQLKIEQQSDGNFGITNIGYLYKLGKVKEQR